jgi:hypothetical protein
VAQAGHMVARRDSSLKADAYCKAVYTNGVVADCYGGLRATLERQRSKGPVFTTGLDAGVSACH